MKKIVLTLTLLAALSVACFAQCDKPVVLNSSKTDHIDPAGALIRTEDEAVVIEISKTEVNVAVNGEHKITALIKSNACNWSMPFKEGKTVIHGVAQRDGQDKPVTLTLEGKDGKVTLVFQMDETPDDRVRVAIDKFAEKT
ncbi:hypothetical protein [Mucilaginibacter sp.]|uniref:hypothetical protein n=1 Tax=Mucilaginibacter sp. TaxID=1882438 RepID=UPI00262FCDC5|nr:hypothetical protein [Mucilaginibacter sp.]MDB4923178.1 hypothetical protein [Mucilaginibacter sp.]